MFSICTELSLGLVLKEDAGKFAAVYLTLLILVEGRSDSEINHLIGLLYDHYFSNTGPF